MTKIKVFIGLAIASIAFVCFAQKTISPVGGLGDVVISQRTNVTTTGNVTAARFIGDGSGLTGVSGGGTINNARGTNTTLVRATVQISNGVPQMIVYTDGTTNVITSGIGISGGTNVYNLGNYTGVVAYAKQVFASFFPTNATASRLLQTGADQGSTNTGVAMSGGSNASGFGTISAGDVISTTAGVVGTTGQFGSMTITGPVSHATFTGTNGNVYRDQYSQKSAINKTNHHGIYYFPSGGTNALDVGEWDEFYLTNNMATNITLWVTNGFATKAFYFNILGPSNGNNYTLTIYSANSWLMALDRNCPTNGGTGTIITVTNNQSVEWSGKFTPTPTNPILNFVYSRKTL